jgi:hypothetical protein
VPNKPCGNRECGQCFVDGRIWQSAVIPFKTFFWPGAAPITTNVGTFARPWRWVAAGAVTAGSWRSNFVSLDGWHLHRGHDRKHFPPDGPTATDFVTGQIEFFFEGPSGRSPPHVAP